MMPSVLCAVRTIAKARNNNLRSYFANYPIRINQVGQQLEYYVKDAVCGSFVTGAGSPAGSGCPFSYLGNQNNPPDFIIRGGDAFEIKKIEKLHATLALNNSPPKDRLHRDDPRITEHCRMAEGGNWGSKDLFYAVGWAEGGELKHLFFVHGRCYAAERGTYDRIALKLKRRMGDAIAEEGLEAVKTSEIGRVARVDPLGITQFRVRGMWEIKSPLKVFSYIYRPELGKSLSLAALMLRDKYMSFPEEDRAELEGAPGVESRAVEVKDPNNPAEALEAQLITASW